MMGRASSCCAVMAPTLAALAMRTRFSAGFSRSAMLRNVRVPVTTTSAVSDSVSVAFAVSVRPAATVTSCRAVEKLTSLKVMVAGPAGASLKRYSPVPSVTAVNCPSTVSSSTRTPGSTPPVSSATTPATTPLLCAAAEAASASTSREVHTDTTLERADIQSGYRLEAGAFSEDFLNVA